MMLMWVWEARYLVIPSLKALTLACAAIFTISICAIQDTTHTSVFVLLQGQGMHPKLGPKE